METKLKQESSSNQSLDNKRKKASALINSLKNHSKKSQRVIVVLSVLLVLSITYSVLSMLTKDPTMKVESNAQKEIEYLTAKNIELQKKVSDLELSNEELNQLVLEMDPDLTGSAPTQDEFITFEGGAGQIEHTVKRGESLWLIAEKYYGDGNKYKNIAQDNKIENANLLETGQILIILK